MNFWSPHIQYNQVNPHGQPVRVPEPGTLALLAAGVAGVAWVRRKSR